MYFALQTNNNKYRGGGEKQIHWSYYSFTVFSSGLKTHLVFYNWTYFCFLHRHTHPNREAHALPIFELLLFVYYGEAILLPSQTHDSLPIVICVIYTCTFPPTALTVVSACCGAYLWVVVHMQCLVMKSVSSVISSFNSPCQCCYMQGWP